MLCASVAVASRAAAMPSARALKVPSADGVPIAYEVHGQGSPALVLVHGWSCDRSYWKEQIEDLVAAIPAGAARSRRSRRIRRSVARTTPWPRSATMSPRWSDSCELGSVVLVGHSMGGDVIVEAARELPGRVIGLVWVDDYKSLGSHRRSDERSRPSSRNSARTSVAQPPASCAACSDPTPIPSSSTASRRTWPRRRRPWR